MATGDLALQQIPNDRDSGTSQIGLLQNPFPTDRVKVSLVNKGFILKPNLGLLHDSSDFMLNPEKRIINRHHMELGKGIPRGDLPPIRNKCCAASSPAARKANSPTRQLPKTNKQHRNKNRRKSDSSPPGQDWNPSQKGNKETRQ